jgi:putative Mn2+ efflux pump MntP
MRSSGFVIFEGGMPLVGLGLGSALAYGIGHIADYLAAAAVTGIGLWMLLSHDEDEESKAARITAYLIGHFDVKHSTFQLEAAAHAGHETGTH